MAFDADKWIEKKHRENLNKLYVSLRDNKPLQLTDKEREFMCKALMWAGNEIEKYKEEAAEESRRAYYLKISDGATDGTDWCQIY